MHLIKRLSYTDNGTAIYWFFFVFFFNRIFMTDNPDVLLQMSLRLDDLCTLSVRPDYILPSEQWHSLWKHHKHLRSNLAWGGVYWEHIKLYLKAPYFSLPVRLDLYTLPEPSASLISMRRQASQRLWEKQYLISYMLARVKACVAICTVCKPANTGALQQCELIVILRILPVAAWITVLYSY